MLPKKSHRDCGKLLIKESRRTVISGKELHLSLVRLALNIKMSCYCGSGQNLYHCCMPIIEGKKKAETPEQLMRARYSAFVLLRFPFLRETTAPEAAQEKDLIENETWAKKVEFIELKIIRSSEQDVQGQVEFKVYFNDSKTVYCHHEISQFRKIQNRWYYRGSANIK